MTASIALVVLDTPVTVSGAALCQTLSVKYAGHAFAPVGNENNMVVADGVHVMIMNMGVPAPINMQVLASRASRYFSGAEAVLKRHKSHIVVAAIGQDRASLKAARAITAVAGALMQMYQSATALIWCENVTTARESALSLCANAFSDDLPLVLWIGFHPFQRDGKPGVLTLGLANFVGREIEMVGGASEIKQVVSNAFDISRYLLVNGPVLNDGNTMDIGLASMRVRHLNSKAFDGLPVLAIEAV